MDDDPRKPPKRKPRDREQPKQLRTMNGFALDVRSASAFCGWSEKKTWRLVARKLLPFRKLGGRVLFLKPELEQWLLNLDGVTLEEAQANQEARHD
jgi:predicted DNA-binding transcriptional regulator AlpA